MDTGDQGIPHGEVCGVRDHKQQRESPACDQQPLPATVIPFSLSFQEQSPVESLQYKFDVVHPPPDEAICPVCLDLAFEPFLVECCGQHFCQQCLNSVRAKENVCPLCRKCALTAMHNKHFERNIVHKLQVRCNEKQTGCQWVGLLGELEYHLAQCQYVKEVCPYECGERVLRQHLEEHQAKLCSQRPFDCGYCDHTGTYREVADQHWSLCMSFPLACPNDCGTKNIPRGELQEHCSIKCPLQEVACDFSHAGCRVQVVRQDLSQHMSDAAQQHIALVSRALLQGKEREIAQLKQLLKEKEDQHKQEMEQKDQLHKKEKENIANHHRLELTKMEREHREAMTKKEDDIVRMDKDHKKEIEMKDKNYEEMVQRMSQLDALMRNHIEMTNQIHRVLGADLNIVFSDYQETRMKTVNWYSPSYYTHFHGYKMCVSVDFMPFFTNLEVYSYLLPGEYDAILKWPFRGTVVVQLLNQLSDDNHYDYVFDYSRASDSQSQRVTSGERSAFMIPSTPHLPLIALEYNASKKCQYLKNDGLVFKIIVKDL